MSDDAGSSRDRWPSLLGLAVLFPAVLLDFVVFAGAARGRHAWIDAIRLSRSGVLFLTVSFVAGGLAHATLAVRNAVRAPRGDAGPFGTAGHRSLQWASGAVVAIFLGVHALRHSPLATLFGLSLSDVYERMRSELSRVPWLAFYVLGLASVALHVFQGIGAAFERAGLRSRRRALRPASVIAFFVATVVFGVALHGLGHFATGRTSPPASAAPAESPSSD